MKAVICGYQGIGKSTLASKDLRYIDLESSNMRNPQGDRSEDWWYVYCNTAIQLAEQGYVVFTSSHEDVRNYLSDTLCRADTDVLFGTCYPAEDLKDEWISRLEIRYSEDPSRKNEAALFNAKDRFVANVREIANTKSDFSVRINSMEYSLDTEVEQAISRCIS